MSAPIGPGDWVECVRLSPTGIGTPMQSLLRVGGVYQVRKVGIVVRGKDGVCRPGILLHGIPERQPNGRRGGFRVDLFRPIYPGGGLIRKLMEPLPDETETPALEPAT